MAIQVQDPPRNILTFPMQIPMLWLLYPGPHSGAFSHPSLFKPAVIPHWGHSQETLLRTAYYIHLSYPKYRPTSVTAHVPPESYSLQYVLLWPCNCHTSGSRPRMLHVPARYKISISQCSCPSLGLGTPRMKWEGLYFFDIVLPFGLRSASSLFDEFSSALEWIILTKVNIPKVIHILDDFFFATSPPRSKCMTTLC